MRERWGTDRGEGEVEDRQVRDWWGKFKILYKCKGLFTWVISCPTDVVTVSPTNWTHRFLLLSRNWLSDN